MLLMQLLRFQFLQEKDKRYKVTHDIVSKEQKDVCMEW